MHLQRASLPLGRLLGNVMVNRTFNFKTRLLGARASAEWYIKKATEVRRDYINDKINDELSGCWRCSGRQQGLCDCCSHNQAVQDLEKLL